MGKYRPIWSRCLWLLLVSHCSSFSHLFFSLLPTQPNRTDWLTVCLTLPIVANDEASLSSVGGFRYRHLLTFFISCSDMISKRGGTFSLERSCDTVNYSKMIFIVDYEIILNTLIELVSLKLILIINKLDALPEGYI